MSFAYHPRFLQMASSKPCIFFFLIAAFFYQKGAFRHNIFTAESVALLFINHAPKFDSGSYACQVSEESVLGSVAGGVSATDEDGDKLAFSIRQGNTNKTLSCNVVTGAITIAKNLNHHTQNRYNLVIRVTDPAGLYKEVPFYIDVKAGDLSAAFTSITWQSATAQPYGTHEIDGGVLNGKLYIFGGFDVLKRPNYTPTKRAFVYDPSTNKWEPIADLPHTPNGAGFGGISNEGLTTDGTDFYFAGGYPSNSSGNGQAFGTKQVWKYNVLANTYISLPGLPIDLAAGQLKYLRGRLHYISGANKARRDTSVHFVLNLDSLSIGWKTLAPVLNATNHAGSVVYDGKIYYISGSHFQNAGAVPQKTVQVYNADTNAWTKVADIPNPRDHITSSVIIAGERIILLGGNSSPNSKSNFVSAYSPAGNTWQSLTPLPVTKAAGVTGVINGNIYYCGGGFTTNTYKGVPPQAMQKVESFTLINADTDQPIKIFGSGDTVNLAVLQTTHLNIRANSSPTNVGSVKFDLMGPQNNGVFDNKAPYALFGDNGNGDYTAWTPPAGKYTLKATPYTSSAAGGIAGISKSIVFTVINNYVNVVSLSPVADAFVRGGTTANTNYGNDPFLNVLGSSSATDTRYVYLKFDLEGIGNVTSATLRLYGKNITNTSRVSLSLYGVNSDSWNEGTINYNNAPNSLTGLLSAIAVTNTAKYNEFDILNFVKSQASGDKILTVMVKDSKNTGLNVVFNSRENVQNKPQLIINSGGQSFALLNNSPISVMEKSTKNLVPASVNNSLKVKLYPNPVHKILKLEFLQGFTSPPDLQIFDPSGKIYAIAKSLIKAGNSKSIEVNISTLLLKPGAYFLKISCAAKQLQVIKFLAE